MEGAVSGRERQKVTTITAQKVPFSLTRKGKRNFRREGRQKPLLKKKHMVQNQKSVREEVRLEGGRETT